MRSSVWSGARSIAGVLVVRLRYLLHFAVLEAALESANVGATSRTRPGARRSARRARCRCSRARTSASSAAPPPGPATRPPASATATTTPSTRRPSVKSTRPAGAAPRDNSKTAIVVGAVAATIILAGAIGQGVAAAGDDDDATAATPRIVLTPDLGSGPTTEDAPDPADPPGPTVGPVRGRRLDRVERQARVVHHGVVPQRAADRRGVHRARRRRASAAARRPTTPSPTTGPAPTRAPATARRRHRPRRHRLHGPGGLGGHVLRGRLRPARRARAATSSPTRTRRRSTSRRWSPTTSTG